MRFVVSETGCWLYSGTVGQDGYGKISIKGVCVRAHRLMAQLTIKPMITGSDVVAHKCDTPLCINPDHLFITNAAGNSKDRDIKNRQAKGSGSGVHKLKEEHIPEIRKKYSQGVSLKTIGLEYGVTPGCIQAVIHKQTWKHVP